MSALSVGSKGDGGRRCQDTECLQRGTRGPNPDTGNPAKHSSTAPARPSTGHMRACCGPGLLEVMLQDPPERPGPMSSLTVNEIRTRGSLLSRAHPPVEERSVPT